MGAVTSRFLSPSWSESKVISTAPGPIKGRKYTFPKGSVEAFLGIPYAKQPLKELRFQKPQKPDPWTEVKVCQEFGHRCPHEELLLEKLNNVAEKGEDCLHLNVFAPDWSPESAEQPDGFAVMVFIHGGGFSVHSSSHYGDYGICEVLCTKDVIVVTINYRLGFFGFSAGDDIPSNIGLWDQTMALQWVRDNIHAFNGNPNNITVFGQSAGGASVDFLTLSPHSQNLFKKAIPMAGTALCSFPHNEKKHVKQVCIDYAVKQGFKPTKENESPFEFLRTLPASALECGIFGSTKVNRNGKLDLTPIFDGDFFPKPFDQLRKEAPTKIIMTGVTEHEGLLFVALRPPRMNVSQEADRLIERELAQYKIQNIDEIKKKLTSIYTNGTNPNSKKDLNKVAVKIVSDIFINNGAWNYADTMTQLGHTVYQYCFEYYNSKDFGLLGFLLPFKASTHGSEMPYLFKRGVIAKFHPNEDDLKMVEAFTTFFTNFAKHDNPNGPEPSPQIWKPLIPGDTLKYLSINLDKIRTCDNLHNARPLVWRSLIRDALQNQEKPNEKQELTEYVKAREQGKL
ncbi:hypothetical protein FO519_006997 [Halicephalobus sp. NKZ332]|nr:hypothetical protein FO519_006997 [Halicephalobus sp. NKZ332]